MASKKLKTDYYRQQDTLFLAKDLLGKVLVTQIGDQRTSGLIVETEAYLGGEDRASHAFGYRRTKRTETMFQAGGISYIYLCYGIHHLFNVITGPENQPHAVLIRGIEPVEGIEMMLERRKMAKMAPRITSGPGSLSRALGLHTGLDGTDLTGKLIFIEDHGESFKSQEILASPRVGVDYAGEDALLPYRFRVKSSKFTSPAK